jgi:GNAT superfamily N-acetyltransferase
LSAGDSLPRPGQEVAGPAPVAARLARPQEAAACVRLLRQLGCFTFQGTDAELEQRLAPQLARPETMHLLVAGTPGEPVALALAYVLPDPSGAPTVYVHDLVVDARARGQGLARVLMQGAVDMAHDVGAAKVMARTDDGNAAAERLYASLGLAEGDRLWEGPVAARDASLPERQRTSDGSG